METHCPTCSRAWSVEDVVEGQCIACGGYLPMNYRLAMGASSDMAPKPRRRLAIRSLQGPRKWQQLVVIGNPGKFFEDPGYPTRLHDDCEAHYKHYSPNRYRITNLEKGSAMPHVVNVYDEYVVKKSERQVACIASFGCN